MERCLNAKPPVWSVFTKPWPQHGAAQLGELVASLGFTGAELPVRENTYVTPENVEQLLPAYVAELADTGVETVSIAADLTEPMFAACQASAVPLIRVMIPVTSNDYHGSLETARARLEGVADTAKSYGVAVAIQPHRGPYVTSCLGVLELIKDLPQEHFRIVWDAAHDALAGDDPVTTLRLAKDRLSIANFKNVVYVPDLQDGLATAAKWKPWYVPALDGLADWYRALSQLRSDRFGGPICLTAQYSDDSKPVETFLRDDLVVAKALWAGESFSPGASPNTLATRC